MAEPSVSGFGAETGEPAEGWLRYVAAGTVSAVGVGLLRIPAFDVWDDATNLGWGVVATLVENTVLVGMCLFLVGAGVWLHRTDWTDEDVALVSKWVVSGAVGVAVVYGFVVVLQLWAMGRPKPYVLAADGVLMASVAAFGVGVYDARRRQSRRRLTVQRDRFQALFERTEAPVAALETEGESLHEREYNEAYEAVFAEEFSAVVEAAEQAGEGEFSTRAFREAVRSQREFRAAVRVPNGCLEPDARRDDPESPLAEGRYFTVRTVPIGDGETFVVLPEITAQKERERLYEERSERLEREETQRERELEQRTDQLEFLHSLLRHDVQNGMMVIESRGEFLERELDGQMAEHAETITSRASDVSDHIDRMRTALETLTAGDRDTHPVDASAVLESRTQTLAETHPSVTVETDVEAGLTVRADEILEDVLANVLRNAVEHNDRERPRVWVDAEETGDSVRIEVADNGPGIDEDARDAVFRRGVSRAGGDGHDGSGFGLFFVDTMVDAYDGDVYVEDNDPEGTRFVVELPTAETDSGG